jgi:hypothetical protein
MGFRTGTRVAAKTRAQPAPPEPIPDPLPEDTYGATRWADMQAAGYIWYPDLKRAIYDEGQASETIAEP